MSRKLKRKENHAKRVAHNSKLESGKEDATVKPAEVSTPTDEVVEEVSKPDSSEELESAPSSTEETTENNPLDVDGDGDVDAADVAAVANAAAAELDASDEEE
jgi:hypothetical protein